MHRIVRVQHDELQLNVAGFKWEPFALTVLLQIDVELHVVLDFIVLRVGALKNGLIPRTRLALLVVPEISGTEHT